MPFIPHTEADVRTMLHAIGVDSIDALFAEIPPALLDAKLEAVPSGMSEMEIMRLMRERAAQVGRYLNFIGAGAYEHHIPAAVWQLATRGEFYSAYTPYQAEASQGTLQLLYEYQTMIASLTGLDAANASLYDGASATAEAVLMAVRLHKSARRVLIAGTLHPIYRQVVQTIVSSQQIELIDVPYSREQGILALESLNSHTAGSVAAIVVQQPNFFGGLESVHELTDWAATHGALSIGVVNPLALGLLSPPGEWGEHGADIAVGEGQPLGVPLSGGGPYFGFMTCKQQHVRQMPGRIVGGTVDTDGRRGFSLTLQAREQHIRRSKATSNICTNQGLAVTAATIYMAIVGPAGLRGAAENCHANLMALLDRVLSIDGVERTFTAPMFHEAVLTLPSDAVTVLERLRQRGILGGYALATHEPELRNAMLICATETKTPQDLEIYATALEAALRE